MSKEETAERLDCIFDRCDSLVVYRCSPGEKADVISKIKQRDPTAYSLAVGDGANDVSMLQIAKIGIGIIGKEGSAAANFSDIAVPTFEGLRRLMFYHGRRFSS